MAMQLRIPTLTARAAAGAALFIFAGSACFAGAAPDHCIVGESAFGCRNERDIVQITQGFHGNTDALRDMIAQDLSAGVCQMFQQGERVYSTGQAGSAERTAVRRARDDTTYWMPASWSRPVDECRAYPAPRSIAGNPLTSTVPTESGAALNAKPVPGSSIAAQTGSTCAFKPVMSDADIAACKSASERE